VLILASEVKDLLPTQKVELKEDIYSEPPLEGGPQTTELTKDPIDSEQSIEVLNINPELLANKKKKLQDVITRNHWVFGLDNRLGHLDQPIQIPLKTGAQAISLPPFHASPTNWEVIDK